MTKYEAAIYNAEVRQKVAEGEHHRHLNDEWAEIHYVEVEANNKESARNTFEAKHPSALGYVIGEIIELD